MCPPYLSARYCSPLPYEYIEALTLRDATASLEFHISPVMVIAAFAVIALLYTRILAAKADAKLNIAAVAFESQVAMAITDAKNNILQVNRAFLECTGYSTEEVIGKNPRIFSSGRHDANFYKSMWESISRTGGWEGGGMEPAQEWRNLSGIS